MNPDFDPAQVINTEPSASLTDDIAETYERLYHRAITQLQVRLQGKIEEMMNDADEWAEQIHHANPGSSLETCKEQVIQSIGKRVKELREKTHFTIEQMKGLLAYRETQASAYLSTHGIQ